MDNRKEITMHFSPRDMLGTGIKVLGLIMLLKSLQAFIGLISVAGLNNNFTTRWELWQVLLTFISPLVLLIVGLCLLKYADRLTDFLCKTDDPEADIQQENLFQLAIKFIGLILIVFAIPEAFRIIGNLFYMKAVSEAIDTVTQSQFVWERSLSTLIRLLLGFYLMCSGRFFYHLAYPVKDE
jgi:hypothetical protein